MKFTLNNREVEALEIEHEETTDFIVSAMYVDADIKLTNDELDQLQEDYASELEQSHWEYQLMQAEDFYSGDR